MRCPSMIAESGFLIARMTLSFVECSVTALRQFDVAVVNAELSTLICPGPHGLEKSGEKWRDG